MKYNPPCLIKFLTWSAKMAGNPLTFVTALCVVTLWLIIGFFIGFDSRWLLILNTIASLNIDELIWVSIPNVFQKLVLG